MQLDYVVAALEHCLPGRAISNVERLAAGWETDVYAFMADQTPLVLRVYSGGDFGDRAAAEARAIGALSRLSYPVPKLVAFVPDTILFGGPALIMERIFGQVMWRHYGSALYDKEPQALFCSLLHRLHELDGRELDSGGLNTFDLAALEIISDAGGLRTPFEPVLEALRRREPEVGRQRRSIIHGDYHHDNILIAADGRPCVIDWSCAALDDPRMDVAQSFVLAMTNGNPDGAHVFLAGYEELNGRPLPDFGFFSLLALTRRVMTVMVTLAAGSGAMGLRPGLEAELRRNAGFIRRGVEMLEQFSGLTLPEVHSKLSAYETS